MVNHQPRSGIGGRNLATRWTDRPWRLRTRPAASTISRSRRRSPDASIAHTRPQPQRRERRTQILAGVIDTLDDALGPGVVVGETIEGAGRTVTSGASRGKLARLGGGLRSLRHGSGGGHRVTRVATAAGLLGGAALAARGNGGIEKTIKELIS
jgi:hypothetical protein